MSGRISLHRGALAAAAAGALLSFQPRARAIVSSTGNGLNGTDVGLSIDAGPLYAAGYTGSRAVVANIEAGYVWTGQETTAPLASSILYFHAPTNDATTSAWTDRHATWVGQAIAGRGSQPYQLGIAYGATLWSGAIATSWDASGTAYSTSFEIATNDAFFSPYYQAALGGVSVVNGPNGSAVTSKNYGTADVITSSWGDSTDNQRELGGNNYFATAIDALASASGKLFVFAAGNGGAPDTIGSPANGSNALVVDALTGDTSSPPYNLPASFSSAGPQNFFIPTARDGSTGTTVPVARARVDISAPGDNLTLALYGGTTGGNAAGLPQAGTSSYSTSLSGTSFATPIVAAAAALLVDAAKDQFPANPLATDGRVLKAILMNSADKTVGWTNNTSLVNGVLVTTQALDLNAGAGRVDAGAAYAQLTNGTADLPGLGGGAVQPAGWDFGAVAAAPGSFTDYALTGSLLAGSRFSATLAWYANGTLDLTDESGDYGSFFNLDLELFLETPGSPNMLIAESATLYDSSEQIYVSLPTSGSYVLRVVDEGALWNFTGDTSVDYGLAWSGTSTIAVPEPAFLTPALCPALALRRRRRA
jgi:hypothetical protein